MQKHSPFYLAFDYHIRKLKETGSIKRYADKYDTEKQSCPDYSGKPISMQQCIVAFKILAAGYLSCAFMLGCEQFMPMKMMSGFYNTTNKNVKKISKKVLEGKTKEKRESRGRWDAIVEREPTAKSNYILKRLRQPLEKFKEKDEKVERKNNSHMIEEFPEMIRKEIYDMRINKLLAMNNDLRKRNLKLIAQNHILKSNVEL